MRMKRGNAAANANALFACSRPADWMTRLPVAPTLS